MSVPSEDLQQEVGKLKAQNEQLEVEFGHKRARFMEMFKQKEDELAACESVLNTLKTEKENSETELAKLKTEISDIKTATAIAEVGREDEMSSLRRKYNEEVASMQHLIKEAVGQAQQATANKFQDELVQMQRLQEKLQAELAEARKKLSQEREGFLDSIAKTLQKKVVRPHTSVEDENLEESMKKAQEDADMLKSVIVPLEEEIASLKEQLARSRQPHGELTPEGDRVEVTQAAGATASSRLGSEEQSEKLRELSKNLQTEKSSRSDLEMYVAVLSAQKSAIQNEAEKIRNDLTEVMKLLEVEKREHTDLKNTWQVATDQFLHSQRLMMMDMRNMESLLSEEQQRQLEELKKADAEREAQEKKVQELEERRLESEEEARRGGEDVVDRSDSSYDKSKGSLSSLVSDEFLKFESEEHKHSSQSSLLQRSQSNQSFSTRDQQFLDSGVHDTKSLNEDTMGEMSSNTSEIQIPVLTEAQHRALADSVRELKISDVALASVKAKSESVSFEGKRLVSQHEWDMMEKELRSSRERLGKPCDMCKNYEAQLQQVQETQKEAQAQARTLDRQLEHERSTIKSLQTYTGELESSVKDTGLTAQNQISDLINQLEISEASVRDMRSHMTKTQGELENEIKRLTEGRLIVQKELRKLEEENDKLIDKHSRHSQQLQEETINLPENLDDMQLLLLKYREDVIAAKVAKESVEEHLKSEIMFLKDQVVSEQQERTTIEDALQTELGELQEQLAILQSVKSELERQNKIRSEAETKLKEKEAALITVQAKAKQLVKALQSQVEEHSGARTRLEGQVHELKMKVQGLQVDLDNSEAVQRDFVKLSQSLQIQLEKIRAAEHEVRWQHEEDLEECGNCKKGFDVLRRKHHCRHCGKIFCIDCLSKTVASGPNNRSSKVCDVCHTILVRDATPYFSTEPPQTPD